MKHRCSNISIYGELPYTYFMQNFGKYEEYSYDQWKLCKYF